ncbi:STY0301 family protein [Sphingomonas bacterium]|uniref:STY0301 family protein n=1 Tax=Sphingomonas bacterium TaxID=1895847 RepID=UPI001574F503|nr:STY0301 family protein [Sphingomonas bacterium]
MSSTRLLPLLLVAASAPHPVRHPATPTCLARHDGVALSSVSVFDGPTSEHADLVPDGSRTIRGVEVSTWDVAYVYQAGRQVYASCRYGASDVVVPVRHPVKTCRYTVAPAAQTLTCR